MIAPPGVVEVNFPVIVAGEPGRIAVNFPGGTGEVERPGDEDYDAAAQRPWFTYMVLSTGALDPDPLLMAATAGPPGDPVHRGDCGPGRCGNMFDFMDINLSPVDGSVWASATDTCTAEEECNSDPVEGRPEDAEGVAVHQTGGPKLLGEGVVAGAQGGAAPSGNAPARSVRRAPSARRARVGCARARCRVRLAGAPAGTAVSLRVFRRGVLRATGSARLRGGRAVVRLRRGNRAARLPRGRYVVLVTVARRGAAPARADHRVRVR
jgi:hypothetical protein